MLLKYFSLYVYVRYKGNRPVYPVSFRSIISEPIHWCVTPIHKILIEELKNKFLKEFLNSEDV